MKYDYSRIPEGMRREERWVLWRKVMRDGRATKMPIDARTGLGAKSNDPSTWRAFDEAMQRCDALGCDGLGFMLGDGFFGVDIDHAMGDESLISEFVGSLKSYSEVSQSGEGIHIICRGSLPKGARRKGNVEMYDSARFFALTGSIYKGMDRLCEDATSEARRLWEKHLAPTPSPYVYSNPRPQPVAVARPLTDAELIRRASEASNGQAFLSLYQGKMDGYDSHSSADMAFCSMLAFWSNGNAEQMDRIFRQSLLMRDKWDQMRGDRTYGQLTVQKAISTCRDFYEGKDEGLYYDPNTGEVAQRRKEYSTDDTGNAQRFVDMFGADLRYNCSDGCWMIWDGKRWRADDTQKVKKYADEMLRAMKREVYQEQDEKMRDALMKNAKRVASSAGKEAMLKEAQHIGAMPTVNGDYDKDPSLLNCGNGVVDLKTGKLMPHRREYMMSKLAGSDVDFNAESKEWEKALDGIFQGDKSMVDYIQKAVGYTLTGETREQCFFQCYGDGSNGKSLFFDTVYAIMGEYAINAQVETFLARGGSSNASNATPEIARMDGMRFVRTSEPGEGSRFNEGLLKEITGGGTVTARKLYGKPFDLRIRIKLWIGTNYKIVVRGTDKGIWRRQRLIPFNATFEGKNDDKGLADRLRDEYPAILAWAVRGAIKWRSEGLEMPDAVRKATDEYRTEMDIVESFCRDCVERVQGAMVSAKEVFAAYRRWAKDSNEWDGMTQQKFGTQMGKKFKKKLVAGYVKYADCRLKPDPAPYVSGGYR